jgi:microcystin-dependent protein
MGTKKITDLQLRDEVSVDCNFPIDDGIQSYRVTAQQINDFILDEDKIETSFVQDEAITRDKIDDVERIPIGSIIPFAGSLASVPSGYLLCDGSEISRSTYAALFAVLAITHGQGNGSTTFNIPDYRGRFLRGVDGAVGRDPDRASRTAMASGGNTGDNVGSIQTDAYKNHTHDDTLAAPAHTHATSSLTYCNKVGHYSDSAPSAGPAAGTNVLTSASAGTTSNTGAASATALTGSVSATTEGSTETRPINAGINFIIKH